MTTNSTIRTGRKLGTFAFAAMMALAALAAAPVEVSAQTTSKKHDHDHAGHDHSAEKKGSDSHGHDHGKAEDLGTTTVAGVKLSVAQMGEVKAGGEAVIGVTLDKGQSKPKAVRAWVGNGSAEGSVKAKGQADGNYYDLHVAVPKSLPGGAQLWIEIEPATGKKSRAAFDLKQ